MQLVLSVNNYRLIVPGYTPNVLLIPYDIANDQNKSIPCPSLLFYIVPQEIHSPPSCNHSPSNFPDIPLSRAIHPLARFLGIGRSKNKGTSLPQNHHNIYNMIMRISGHYWVLVSHSDPAPEVLYQHIVSCSNSFFHCC